MITDASIMNNDDNAFLIDNLYVDLEKYIVNLLDKSYDLAIKETVDEYRKLPIESFPNLYISRYLQNKLTKKSSMKYDQMADILLKTMIGDKGKLLENSLNDKNVYINRINHNHDMQNVSKTFPKNSDDNDDDNNDNGINHDYGEDLKPFDIPTDISLTLNNNKKKCRYDKENYLINNKNSMNGIMTVMNSKHSSYSQQYFKKKRISKNLDMPLKSSNMDL